VDESPTEQVSKNPLIGSYPYGRTGRGLQDPLAGFMYCKYTKAGKPCVRLIKPGKHTPYKVIDQDVATPYQERGRKVPRQSNGKYRHIASYSMKELMALGWDGAKYCPQNYTALRGVWVPFICGYDSDPDDVYEPVDIGAGRKAGTIGIPPEEVGLYMNIPQNGIVQLREGH
jgi:hypothetical protein